MTRWAWFVVLVTSPAWAQTQASQYSPLAQVRRDNVKQLKVAWIYRTGEPLTPLEGGGRAPAFEPTPVYANGLIYIGTPYGKAAAIDPLSGQEKWTFDARINRKGNFGDFANRGVSVWTDHSAKQSGACHARVFFASIGAQLFALDALTGKPCPGFGAQGKIDLTAGLRRRPEYVGEYEQTSPPAIIGDLVVVGSAIADNNRADSPTGEVRAFDARTGALRWTWDPMPGTPQAGAANAWSRIVADEERGLIFIPTGSPSPDYYGGLRAGDNRHANSLVALEARTGKLVWSFQTVHHDLWDYDLAGPPALFTARREGTTISGVAAASKTGHLFLLDRATGKPLFAVDERQVPKSDIPGEEASPTQPVPSAPPPLVPQRLAADEAWGPTESDRAWCRDQIAALRSEGIFTPPTFKGTLVVPGNIGGMHWGGAAFDPEHGLLITPTNRFPAVVRLVPQSQVKEYRKTHPDWETTDQKGAPYAMSRKFLFSPAGLPCSPPPFGFLTAVDTATGRIRWQVPLGTLPLPGAKPEWGSMNLGGPLATAGGLVFIGATLDPAFRAFDVETGAELWKAPLPASARATPMTFQSPTDKQFILIAAGGHHSKYGKLDNAIIAFTLP